MVNDDELCPGARTHQGPQQVARCSEHVMAQADQWRAIMSSLQQACFDKLLAVAEDGTQCAKPLQVVPLKVC